jgi:hypothetical protein
MGFREKYINIPKIVDEIEERSAPSLGARGDG